MKIIVVIALFYNVLYYFVLKMLFLLICKLKEAKKYQLFEKTLN